MIAHGRLDKVSLEGPMDRFRIRFPVRRECDWVVGGSRERAEEEDEGDGERRGEKTGTVTINS